MSERKVDEALMDRIIAAVDEAGVSRAAVEGEWPECHKPRCQGHHGSPDVAMSYMKHQIIEAVKLELRYEATTRPDVSRTGDTPEQTAAFTLGVLLHQYRPDVTGTYAKAAQLIVDAYPGIIPALSGVVAEEPEWEPSAQDLLDAIYNPDEDSENHSVRYGYILEQLERLRGKR